MEEFRSEVLMVTYPAALEMRTAATAKMAAEGLKHFEIDVFQNTAFPLNEAAEMCRPSNVLNGAGCRISIAFEVICKRIDLWSTDPRAQASQRFGCGEVLFEHELSLLNIGQLGPHQLSRSPELMGSHMPRLLFGNSYLHLFCCPGPH